MVTSNSFEELISLSLKTEVLNLPKHVPSFLKVDFEDNTDPETKYSGKEPTLPFSSSDVFYAPITSWRRLSAEHEECKPVYEVVFDVTGSNFQFNPGDTIGIIPKNKTSEVDFILRHLELTSQADISCTITEAKLSKSSKFPHLPTKSTLRHILTNIVDIRGVLKKLFLLALSQYTEEKDERRILEYLSSKEGSTAYTTHILNKNICVLDIFRILPSCKPPIEVFLENLPRLLPRPYSIVNSGLNNSNIIKICFSVMNIGNQRKGLTTSWIEDNILKESADLTIEERIKNMGLNESSNKIEFPIYMRKNVTNFSLPKDIETPLLLIGPGTGVGPFIGFLEQRMIVKENNSEINLGETHLYFGCRNPELDFLYKKELDEFISKGVLNKLRTAFSRLDGKNKYIQDLILEDGKEIVQFINSGASIFVCGDLNSMAKQISDTFVRCFVEYGSKTEQEALQYISDLQKNNKYLVDMWS